MVALGGYWPTVHGWQAPVRPMDGVQVMLIHDPAEERISKPLLEETARALTARGAIVESRWIAGASSLEVAELAVPVRQALACPAMALPAAIPINPLH
ncbi:hypothetical protein AWV79_37005 [Cupriavidus sp. UYMMa02A]|nr:hypothetical protein AWV79_37005 [Cupriavidus sp. UYMMa02A]